MYQLKSNKFRILLGLLFLLSLDLFSQNEYDEKVKSSLMNSDSRVMINLAGNWQLSYDDQIKQVDLPIGIETEEKIELQRTIKVNRDLIKQKSWHLFFLGVDSEIEIYVNGQYIGRYLAAMSPLQVPIKSKYLDSDNIEFKFIVYPVAGLTKLNNGFGLRNQKLLTGVIRDFYLVGSSKTWIKSVVSNAKANSKYTRARVNSKIQLRSSQIGRFNLKASVIDPRNGNVLSEKNYSDTIGVERTKEVEFNLDIPSPRLWSHSEPNLYQLKVQVSGTNIDDDLTKNIGVKTLNVRDGKLILNGNELFIKSVDYYEDYYGAYGSVPTKIIEKDLLNLRKLGVNAINYQGIVPHPYFTYLCDKYGIIIFVDNLIGMIPPGNFNSDEIQVRLENIADMSRSYFGSNVSVAAWGDSYYNLGSINQKFENILGFRRINIKENFEAAEDSLIIVDVSNYKLSIEDIKQRISTIRNQTDAALIINYGSSVQLKNNNGYSDILSLDYQANRIRNLFHFSKSENLSGISVYSYNDYLLNYPSLISNIENKYISTTGLVDRQRNTRLAFNTLSALLNNEKEPLLNSGSWVDKTNYLFIIIGLLVIILLLFLLNRLRRFREYFLRSIVRPYNFYSDIRDQRLVSSTQTFVLSIFISLTAGIYLADLFYFHRFDVQCEYILMLFLRDQDVLKNIYSLIWKPEIFMLIISSSIFLVMYILSFILKIISLFVRSRIFFHDTITITVWSGIPTIFLLPLALISNQLLSIHPFATYVLLVIFVFFIIWYLNRLLKAISVVFDVASWKTYLIGIGLLSVSILFMLSVYQINYTLIDYVRLFVGTLG